MGTGRSLAISIYVWFALAVTLSTLDVLPRLPAPAIGGIILGVFVLFLWWAMATKKSRDFVGHLNLRWVTMFHLWRIVPGIGFLALYWFELLPGRFALPTGIGDLLIALSAPLVANRIEFAHQKTLLGWHVLGGLVILYGITVGLALALAGDSQITLMAHFPLSILGFFFVPLTLTMHAFAFHIFFAQTPRTSQ